MASGNYMKVLSYLAVILVNFATTKALATNIKHNQQENTPQPRIIALSPHIVEMLFTIGAGQQIIATTDHTDYPAAAAKIPKIGTSSRIQLERVIELQPDLIIAWESGNPSDELARIKQLGFKVIYSQPDTFEDVAKELRLFGQLTDHSEKAEKIADKFLVDLSNIKQQFANKSAINGFYEVWSRPLTTIAEGSWPQQFLDICGINNPFAQARVGYPQINIEQVLQANVGVIIQPLAKKQTDENSYNWQKWPVVPAVKHQQMITIDADVIHRMTTRSLSALLDLCQQAEKSRQYYQQLGS